MDRSQNQVRLLPDDVANKIAAGEVVERPASVLKELIENSIDAGATQLDVEISGGGQKAIIISDNGRGMNRDDAILCVERHATSKIRDVEDIERVATLGFRGEALAAISSVSRFSIKTRPTDAMHGTEVTMAGGKILDVQDAGCPVGTTMSVRNLFYNVPARKKFLRTDPTEQAHVRQVFLVYALAHPNVGMRLVIDDREVYRLLPSPKLEDRLRELFGPELVGALRAVDYASAEIKISGYVSLPQLTRGERSDQYIFINGRPATAPVIGFAISEAYHTLIPKGRYPVVFLFIELDPGLVDVNVHPTKREVRFRNGGLVRDGLMVAIRKALALSSDMVEAKTDAPVREFLDRVQAGTVIRKTDVATPADFKYPAIQAQSSLPLPQEVSHIERPPIAAASEMQTGKTLWTRHRVLGQVGGLYVILETDEGLVVMDPHAAHERVLYEKFMKEILQHRVNSQGLLAPETVNLAPVHAERVSKNMELFKTMGFGISDFGGDTFLVDAMPICLGNISAARILQEIAETLDKGGARGGTERWAEEQIAQAACKAAVKANDALNLYEIDNLLLDLAQSEMPYTCPHGRPTLIFMSYHELGRKFGRE